MGRVFHTEWEIVMTPVEGNMQFGLFPMER